MADVADLIRHRKRQDFLFNIVGLVCTLVGILTLAVLLCDLAYDGLA